MGKKASSTTPEVWCDEGFELFSGAGNYDLEDAIDGIEKLLPLLKGLNGLEAKVTEYINAGVVKGLNGVLNEASYIFCVSEDNEAGKVMVNLGDDIHCFTIDMQANVDVIASGEIAEPEVMEAWAVWLEAAAKKIRGGIPK